jgi:GlpG protein
MRKIGHIDGETQARAFADYLYSRGISGELEGDSDGGVDVWVHDEDRLDEAASELKDYLADPEAEKYLEAMAVAEDLRHEQRRAERDFQRKMRGRESITNVGLRRAAPVTFGLIVISVLVTLVAGLQSGSPLVPWLYITAIQAPGHHLVEVMHGQIWRLVTPVFMHQALTLGAFGFMHLLFNMMWLKDLGQMLERAQGARNMLIKFLVLAVLSNLGQYFVSGPAFGGMSGVVFGLLGYCWIRGKEDVTSGLYVNNQTAAFMFAWFFICLAGFMGPIANTAHGVGLAVGVVWGWLDSRVRR